ncbi:pilus assembly protein [Streptomyces sp. XM4193]|nr:pilus assembly protein [Streptomyces sp. XM4193]
MALAGVQLGLVAYTAAQSGTAARAAARTASQDAGGSPAAAGREAISGWLADGAAFAQDTPEGEVTVTATLRIPSVIPGVDLGSVQRSSTMPRADD